MAVSEAPAHSGVPEIESRGFNNWSVIPDGTRTEGHSCWTVRRR